VANHKSRLVQLKADPIAKVRLARLSAVDVDRWHARLARNGVGDGSIRNQHQALRAAVTQAVRWGWVNTNVVAMAQLGKRKQVPRGALGEDEVWRVLAAAEELADSLEVEPAAPIALRLAAIHWGSTVRAGCVAVVRPRPRPSHHRLERGHHPARQS
jgi:hypothetical protein